MSQTKENNNECSIANQQNVICHDFRYFRRQSHNQSRGYDWLFQIQKSTRSEVVGAFVWLDPNSRRCFGNPGYLCRPWRAAAQRDTRDHCPEDARLLDPERPTGQTDRISGFLEEHLNGRWSHIHFRRYRYSKLQLRLGADREPVLD